MWAWCQCGTDSENASGHSCKFPAGWPDWRWVPSHHQHRHGWIFHPLSLYTGHQTYRLRLGGMRSHVTFTFSLFLFVCLFSSWTKSVNHMLGVGALRLQICIQLWDSDCVYLGKQSSWAEWTLFLCFQLPLFFHYQVPQYHTIRRLKLCTLLALSSTNHVSKFQGSMCSHCFFHDFFHKVKMTNFKTVKEMLLF